VVRLVVRLVVWVVILVVVWLVVWVRNLSLKLRIPEAETFY
jgi:hypothetical protein